MYIFANTCKIYAQSCQKFHIFFSCIAWYQTGSVSNVMGNMQKCRPDPAHTVFHQGGAAWKLLALISLMFHPTPTYSISGSATAFSWDSPFEKSLSEFSLKAVTVNTGGSTGRPPLLALLRVSQGLPRPLEQGKGFFSLYSLSCFPTISITLLKGTVSRDGFGCWWHVSSRPK
jgi:hypothetical protein